MKKKGLKILISAIKNAQKTESDRWWETYTNNISNLDFEIAKSENAMFDLEIISHNNIFKRIKEAVGKIDKKSVVNSFLYSLSTQKLEYRSFLSSYCIAKVLPEHDFFASDFPNENICRICGLRLYQLENPIDFNLFNYFKHQDGSCNDNADYILFDLENFKNFPNANPVRQDFEILNCLKEKISSAQYTDRPNKIINLIKNCIKSNQYQRQAILEIFGICGILNSNEHVGYTEKYITYLERKRRPIRNDDILYPLRWWEGKYGINEKNWNYWFKQ
ncbi:hypothetical protein [Flavobacterium olei]|uniref:hypothetical protein n=1 Tax=Flavobacterium olei TaxID=1886782 RepID=UPI00321C0A2C